jgi:spore maturation protein CgeB
MRGAPPWINCARGYNARAVAPLYGSVDPDAHYPVRPVEKYRASLSYLGTFAPDRQARLQSLLIEPARRLPGRKFLVAGSMYDESFPWEPNIYLISHLSMADHPAFYCSATLNLNVTRQAMFENGFCPSGRLFEAAACGAPVLSDKWPGLESFFEPGSEILTAQDPWEVEERLDRSPASLVRLARNARANRSSSRN